MTALQSNSHGDEVPWTHSRGVQGRSLSPLTDLVPEICIPRNNFYVLLDSLLLLWKQFLVHLPQRTPNPWFHAKPPENSFIPAVIKHLEKASSTQPLCQASTSYSSQQSGRHKLQNPPWWVKQCQKTNLDLCGKQPLGSSPRQTHCISFSQQLIATFPCSWWPSLWKQRGEHTSVPQPRLLSA